MANINIAVPDELHRSVKLAAVLADTTLKEHIIKLLDDGLRRRGR